MEFIRYESAIRRIKALQARPEMPKRSDGVLVDEYLRRAAYLVKKFSLEGKVNSFPIVNMARLIHKDDLEILEDDVADICGMTQKIICFAYLEWSKLADLGNPVAIEYADLYEPLLSALER